MRVYVYEGIPLVHISTFAQETNINVSTARTLLSRRAIMGASAGLSKRRPLKAFRDGVTLWIPVVEIYGYPFVRGDCVYHYNEKGERYLCKTCTFTNEMCEAAKKAVELEVPIGDPI